MKRLKQLQQMKFNETRQLLLELGEESAWIFMQLEGKQRSADVHGEAPKQVSPEPSPLLYHAFKLTSPDWADGNT